VIDEIILADGITFILLYRKLKNTEKCILQNNSTPLGGFFAIKMIKLSQLREKHCPNCRRNYKNTEKTFSPSYADGMWINTYLAEPINITPRNITSFSPFTFCIIASIIISENSSTKIHNICTWCSATTS